MSNGIIGRLLNGGLWRSSLTGFWQVTADGNLDPAVANLPLEQPSDGIARGLASAEGSGSGVAVGTLAAGIRAAAFVSRAELRAKKKVRPAKAQVTGQAHAEGAGYFLSSGVAQASGAGGATAAAVTLSWGLGQATAAGTAVAIGANATPAARPYAQGWIIF